MPQLLLFDIDGTLVVTGRAGFRAMNRAFAEVEGVADALDGIPLAGRTDRAIIGDVLARFAPERADDLPWLESFCERYLGHLGDELTVDRADKHVLPGIEALLDALAGRPQTHVALLTGNLARGAQVKLGYFDLWHHFSFGAFGDHSVDRNDLMDVALSLARAKGLSLGGGADVVVVGDTPHDVACARSGGAHALAVATGPFSVEALRETGADAVMPDLRDTARVIEVLDTFAARLP